MYQIAVEFARESWLVLGQMAPYLLFGFLIAGLLSVFISPAWVERHLGKPGLRSVFTASLVGVPLPLCSCGVIPVSASIRRHGASRAATTSFLLSTPQTGVDSIAVTYAMLGPVFAVFRPLAALATGILGGVLVQLFDSSDETGPSPQPESVGCTDSCCQGDQSRGPLARALVYGFITLPRDIGGALVVGILIAGAMAALIPPGELHAYVGGGIASILLLMALGVPLYVCATASVPIAAGLIHMGASPGAALAFLIAGPATNAAALTTIWKVLGRRTAILYLVTVAASAIGWGLFLDWLVPTVQTALPQLGQHLHHGGEAGWLPHLSAVALLVVLVFSYRAGASKTVEDSAAADDSSARQRLELVISGMNCSHCAETVKRGLLECPGVVEVGVEMENGRCTVRGMDLDDKQLADVVTGLGYAVETA
jgi:uncharacterized protein